MRWQLTVDKQKNVICFGLYFAEKPTRAGQIKSLINRLLGCKDMSIIHEIIQNSTNFIVVPLCSYSLNFLPNAAHPANPAHTGLYSCPASWERFRDQKKLFFPPKELLLAYRDSEESEGLGQHSLRAL